MTTSRGHAFEFIPILRTYRRRWRQWLRASHGGHNDCNINRDFECEFERDNAICNAMWSVNTLWSVKSNVICNANMIQYAIRGDVIPGSINTNLVIQTMNSTPRTIAARRRIGSLVRHMCLLKVLSCYSCSHFVVAAVLETSWDRLFLGCARKALEPRVCVFTGAWNVS